MSMEEAIKNDDIEAVKALIEKGADPNRQLWVDKGTKQSLLMLCIQENKFEIAKYLIQVGANTTPNDYQDTPLNLAISQENLKMIELLLDNGADLTMSNGLVHAIKSNSLEIVRELIKRGADVNRPSSSYYSNFPILCAVLTDNLDILKLLLENGASANFVYYNGDTPLLHYLKVQNSNKINYDTLKFLLENGSNINCANNAGNTPLLSCVRIRDVNCHILKLLFENGANLNCVDDKGDTPLTTSVRAMNFPMTEHLIKNKADLNVKNAENKSPLSIALSLQDFRTFKLLIESGADPETASRAIENMAEKNPDFEFYMSTLEKPKNVDDPQLTGSTVHEAAHE